VRFSERPCSAAAGRRRAHRRRWQPPLTQHTVTVRYTSGKGAERRTETGLFLADLLPPDALATTDRKNEILTFAVLVVGADGYAALVS